jgi:hypothetical protein
VPDKLVKPKRNIKTIPGFLTVCKAIRLFKLNAITLMLVSSMLNFAVSFTTASIAPSILAKSMRAGYLNLANSFPVRTVLQAG